MLPQSGTPRAFPFSQPNPRRSKSRKRNVLNRFVLSDRLKTQHNPVGRISLQRFAAFSLSENLNPDP
jgi:hypothetical protein